MSRIARRAWGRVALAFAIAWIGLLLVDGLLTGSSWCWLHYVAVGLLAGVAAGRVRRIWTVWVAAVASYLVAPGLGIPAADTTWLFWFGVSLVGVGLATAGFGVGAWAESRHRAGGRADVGPTRGRSEAAVLALALGVGLAGFAGWVGFALVEGSRQLVQPSDTWPDCDTPMTRFGWAYEAVNYDLALDEQLIATSPTMKDCAPTDAAAGSEVVAEDGVPIAGWYIPAAGGIGPRGPTLVVVPGWKSHKSEVLKYAQPFHQDYNLVLLDLRNQGRSGGDATTWGLGEQLDVRAMIDWLVRTRDPAWIGAVGNSMGAATALLEAVHDPRVRALVLDSMHASIVTSFTDGLGSEQHLPGIPTAPAMIVGGSLRVGQDLTSADPVRTIGLLGDRPVLLIHGLHDELDRPETSAERNLEAALAAGVPAALRTCEAGYHGHVIDACPEWGAWATAFLAAARG